jgi:hypothetical protein
MEGNRSAPSTFILARNSSPATFKEGKAPLFKNGKHPQVIRHRRYTVNAVKTGKDSQRDFSRWRDRMVIFGASGGKEEKILLYF